MTTTCSMQLTVQLPQGLNAGHRTHSSASNRTCSQLWSCSADEGGPPTPPTGCTSHVQCRSDTAASATAVASRPAFGTLQLMIPGTPDACSDSSCAPTAQRVLKLCGSYASVCDWLDQQVSKHVGPTGRLIAACSHTPVDLDPALEPPATPAQSDSPTGLPAPAFQLLGLL